MMQIPETRQTPEARQTPAEEVLAVYPQFCDFFPLSKATWQAAAPLMSVIHVPKKTSLQAVMQPVINSYFIVSGLTRMFYITPDGKEMNKAFYGENSMVGNLSALIVNEPSRFAIETLEDSTLLVMPVPKLRTIYHDFPELEALHNFGCQMMLVRNERREAELLTMTSKERFQRFVKNFPGYLERIPQYHIASYLGITPVALSKYKQQWLEP